MTLAFPDDTDTDTDAPETPDTDVDAKIEEILAKKKAKAEAPPPVVAPPPVMPALPVDPSAETLTKRNVETIAVPTVDASAFYNRRMAARARE